MTSNRTQRLRPEVAKADRVALNALNDLPDYAPHNPDYNIDALMKLKQALDQALLNEERIQKMLTTAHDAVKAAQWALHEALLGAKLQVRAQYGDDSDAIQALGLKKKSKRRRGVAHPTKND
jgi:hypothetical protein